MLQSKAENQRADNNQLFDWQLYGALIRLERTKQGMYKAALLSDAIYSRTGFRVSKYVLYRIEQNRQEPTAMQFVSINMTLWQTPYPDSNLFQCLSDAWKHIAEENGEQDV